MCIDGGKGVVLGENKDALLMCNVPTDVAFVDEVGQDAFNFVNIDVGGGVHGLMQLKDKLDGEA